MRTLLSWFFRMAMMALRKASTLQSLILLRLGRVVGATSATSERFSSTPPAAPPIEDRGSTAANIDCSCYLTENFYVRSPVEGHFTYTGAAAFEHDNAALLASLTPTMRTELLANLQKEADRRSQQAPLAAARKARIASEYTPLHPTLWELRDEWLHPDFVALVDGAKAAGAGAGAASSPRRPSSSPPPPPRRAPLASGGSGRWKPPRSIADGVYALPVFSRRFCTLLCEELDHFKASGLPCGQPNSMNRFGALLDELGFSPRLIDPLISEYLEPLCSALPPLAAVGGGSLDRHKTFVVAYKLGEDESLSTHFDNAEVTLNVNLGVEFDDGELLFYGHRESAKEAPVAYHSWDAGVGHAVLHLGQQIHAALPITSGDRRNLVIWMRSSQWRRRAGCPMCGSTDRLIERRL